MTLRAWFFVLTEVPTGRLVAKAIVCPQARYAALVSAGRVKPELRFTTAHDWMIVADELAYELETGVVPREASVWQLLVDDVSDPVVVRCYGWRDGTVDALTWAPTMLERMLQEEQVS